MDGTATIMDVTGEQFEMKDTPFSVAIKQILERYPDGQIFKVVQCIATQRRSYMHILQLQILMVTDLKKTSNDRCAWSIHDYYHSRYFSS